MFGTVTLNPCIDKTVSVKGFRVGGLNRIVASKSQPSGKGINVSIAYKNLGGKTFCTGINYVSNRDVIEDFLKEQNIKNDFYTIPGELRTNLKIFDTQKEEVTEVNASGYMVPDDYEKNLLDKIVKLSKSFNVISLSGSVPQGVSADIYEKIINAVKNPNIKVVLDADGELFKNAIKACPYMIKPNDYELELYTGKKLSSNKEIAEVARKEFIEKGISVVCVSLGADGALIIDKDESFYARGMKVKVKGTVGAGDSIVAGIVYGMRQDMPLKDLLRSGVASATASVVKDGTDLCDKTGYDKYFQLVEIEKILI